MQETELWTFVKDPYYERSVIRNATTTRYRLDLKAMVLSVSAVGTTMLGQSPLE